MFKKLATQCSADTNDHKQMEGYGDGRIVQLKTTAFDDTTVLNELTPRFGNDIKMINVRGTTYLFANGVIHQIMYSSRTNVLFLRRVFSIPVNELNEWTFLPVDAKLLHNTINTVIGHTSCITIPFSDTVLIIDCNSHAIWIGQWDSNKFIVNKC